MPNPKVELYLADLSNNGIKKKLILPPASLDYEEVHFSWVTWANEDKFAISWMNRVQVSLNLHNANSYFTC